METKNNNIKKIVDIKQKNKIKKILDELIEEKIIKEYWMDLWGDGYITNKNNYIIKKFKEIGIKSYLIRECQAKETCENYYLTEEDEKNNEWCSNNKCVFYTYIEIPMIDENKIIDKIFEKMEE